MLKKNEYFYDVSSYQPENLNNLGLGRIKTIIKVSESTTYLNPKMYGQTNSSDAQGYYHFARFGGSQAQAVAEADFFVRHLPQKNIKYLVCDYEDSASGNVNANTNAILAFMDTVARHGFEPIYYSYKPYTLSHVDYHRILERYPNSLWIAAYPNYNVTPNPVWEVFPSMDGIRWWQFTSTGIAGGLDKNVVLIDDNQNTIKNAKKETKEESENDYMNAVVRSTSGRQGYVAILENGKRFGIAHIETVGELQKAGFKHLTLPDDDFTRLISRYEDK